MQDRLKFRFFHKPTNKMMPCYGYNEHFVFGDTMDGIYTEYNPANFDDCILMQCTGLKDKSGKPIFEGDIIVKNWDNRIFKIIWKNDACCFMAANKNFTVSIYSLISLKNDLEVIGNIYENPELLEVNNANIQS